MRVIEPPKGWSFPNLRELWQQRDLLYLLARRDVAVRYKQSVVGAGWAILQPLLLAAVFTVFFGILINVDSPAGVPYPVFVVTGFVMWLFFAQGLSDVSFSTLANSVLISKLYFPRLTIPISAAFPSLVDFAFGLLVAIVVTVAYGVALSPEILLLPIAVLFAMITFFGSGLWMAALNVRYRDVVMLVPFITQVGMFLTPVVYPIEYVPENLQAIYTLNPMVGVLELYRWMLLPTDFPSVLLVISMTTSAVLLVTGATYFKKAEQTFADVI